MAIHYEFYRNPDSNGTGERRYHARVVNYGQVNTEMLVGEMMKGSSVSRGEVRGMLMTLADKLKEYLGDGRRVTIAGIGTFQVNLRCKREVTDPDEAQSRDIEFKSISFRADKGLREEMKRKKILRSSLKPHSMPLTEEELRAKLEEYFSKEEVITRRGLQIYCNLTKSTAIRTLKRLVEQGIVRNVSTDKNPVYMLNRP
ncbi:MAG: HU family DNA-binding protein [Bacteroides sp.]|nr:HU family DNA-binding protein [Bacteroides sp.]